ncbi:LysR family transcriptional regulator [Pseudorhodoplanes sp.]|uniref:LysR family transcriptional regulator n=1 Tax=Pseudorhodoplanes sp. TaxID=1934341 RepID=UPI002C801FB6|nr:LysR family transcriptional regulator [Pseudorhodoplanes sp.]HWV53421.1 LysR family transcriptional regulator [Pseudorhodoplanes sp.]
MPAHATLRQIQAVIAVCEEGSFTRAAEREHATQSGISQHVAAVEKALGVRLFERTTTGVTPTAAGLRYYRRCVDAIGLLETAGEDIRALSGRVSGRLRIGLMPTFTRAALAPTLQHFVPAYPDVQLHILEAYSGTLTDQVLNDQLDFAIVPAFEGRVGLKSRLILRDREVLISGRTSPLKPLAPVRLSDCAPLKIVVPGPDNVRRRNLEVYFQSNGVAIDRMIEMDAMMATFDLVARTDFVTVLPGLICINDIGRDEFIINPIDHPSLYAEFILITPSRRTLSTPARLFLERFEADLAETGKRLTALLKGGRKQPQR